MGNRSSSPRDERSWRQSSSARSSSPAGWLHVYSYGQSPFSQQAQKYPVENTYPAGYPPVTYDSQDYKTPADPYVPTQQTMPPLHKKKFDRRYSRIADNYNSLEEVTEALARAGLEFSNLIIGFDFTKSNEWTDTIIGTRLG